jgi:hypothetical protein|nr:MAG TPA: hypothetical protein [Caudoviricetes sp.]DAZ40964.1 MAG TPA: hypothetical protein [Caudoviricetes sp.]
MAQIGIRPSTRVIKLKDLPVGDVFSKKNIFYIKTNTERTRIDGENKDTKHDDCVVNLATGELIFLNNEEYITKIENFISLNI